MIVVMAIIYLNQKTVGIAMNAGASINAIVALQDMNLKMVVVFKEKGNVLMVNINTTLPKIVRGIVIRAKIRIREIMANIDVIVMALCIMANV
jgi:hypothetical protein